MNSIKPINKIAFDLLLFFYKLERNEKINLEELSFNFGKRTFKSGYKFQVKENQIDKKFFEIANKSSKDLLNSLKFLIDEGLIFTKNAIDTGGISYFLTRLTSDGFKLIEGVEDSKYKEKLEKHFHIKLAENINLESLIKNSLL